MSGKRRIDELSNIDLMSSSELEKYTKEVRDLCRDLYMELEFSAAELRAALSAMPSPFGRQPLTSKVRARTVSWCLRRAAEAVKFAGSQSVKCWALFRKNYSAELKATRRTQPARKFRIDQ